MTERLQPPERELPEDQLYYDLRALFIEKGEQARTELGATCDIPVTEAPPKIELNETHRRIAEEARERIKRLISGQAIREAWAGADTRLADRHNDPAFDRMEVGTVDGPYATEAELEQ